jgi:hypothetical protein
MYCSNCGAKNEINAKFCKSCGTKLVHEEQQSEVNKSPALEQKDITTSQEIKVEDTTTSQEAGASASKKAEQQKAFNDLYVYVAKEIGRGIKIQQIVKALNKLGFTDDDALNFIGRVQKDIEQYRESPEAKRIMAEKYQKVMLSGVLWFFGGLLFTGITYGVASSNGGGTYFITWGAMLFGAYDFIRGLFGWIKYSNK